MQVTTGRKRHHGRRHDAARDLGIVNVEELADNEDGIILTARQGVVQAIVPLVVVHEVKLERVLLRMPDWSEDAHRHLDKKCTSFLSGCESLMR
jgi:RNase P/RNase MRP subunit POP5